MLPHWLDRGRGLVVNVSSMGGHVAIANESAYNTSKFALAGWSEALRIDLEGTGVAVKLVLPGPIATEIWDQPGNEDPLFEIDKVPAADCRGRDRRRHRGRRLRVLHTADLPRRARRQADGGRQDGELRRLPRGHGRVRSVAPLVTLVTLVA